MSDWYVTLIIKCCTWWILLILFGYYFYDIVKWVACFFGVYVLVCVCNYVFWWLVCVGYFFGSYWYVFIERDVGVKMHPHLYLYEVILPLSFHHLSNAKFAITTQTTPNIHMCTLFLLNNIVPHCYSMTTNVSLCLAAVIKPNLG